MRMVIYGNKKNTKLMDVFEEIIIFVVSNGYYFAAIPFILGIMGAIVEIYLN